jgi:hypothetical protein
MLHQCPCNRIDSFIGLFDGATSLPAGSKPSFHGSKTRIFVLHPDARAILVHRHCAPGFLIWDLEAEHHYPPASMGAVAVGLWLK